MRTRGHEVGVLGKSVTLTHLEAVNQVVSGQQLVEDKLERVISAGVIQSEHVKGPRVHVLQ